MTLIDELRAFATTEPYADDLILRAADALDALRGALVHIAVFVDRPGPLTGADAADAIKIARAALEATRG